MCKEEILKSYVEYRNIIDECDVEQGTCEADKLDLQKLIMSYEQAIADCKEKIEKKDSKIKSIGAKRLSAVEHCFNNEIRKAIIQYQVDSGAPPSKIRVLRKADATIEDENECPVFEEFEMFIEVANIIESIKGIEQPENNCETSIQNNYDTENTGNISEDLQKTSKRMRVGKLRSIVSIFGIVKKRYFSGDKAEGCD